MKTIEKTAVFFGAIAVLSLLEFHLDWMDQIRIKDLGFFAALQAALASGPLFFFTVPLAVAAFFEVWSHQALHRNLHARLLAYGCAFPCLAMVFECFRVRYGAAPADLTYCYVQGLAAILTILVATSIKFLAHRSTSAIA